MDAQDIIIRPLLTEKSYQGFNNENDKKKKAGADGKLKKTYTFVVHKDANKTMIKEAVEKLFEGVKVDKVNTVNVRGKWRRMGRSEGKTASYKKAMVILKKDSKTIPFFDSLA